MIGQIAGHDPLDHARGEQHRHGGLLFLLSAGFSLIFGLMRIPNLMHGSFFMLGAYFGVTLLGHEVELLGGGARERRSPWR